MARVILTVTSDLVIDQRVHRIATSLQNMGFDVLVVGRQFRHSEEVIRPYQVRRFKLWFNKSWLFYTSYNMRLFLFLLVKKRYDIIVANDLDTLPASALASSFRCKYLIYDAHEYFPEIPELVNRPTIRKVWSFFERSLVPGVHAAYTVCQSLATIYQEKYGVPFHVVRNLPYRNTIADNGVLKRMFPGKKVVIYQGYVNKGRGLELMVEAMKYVNGVVLVIAGDGDIKPEIENRVNENKLRSKVHFTGRVPFKSLAKYTQSADMGISLEEDIGLNYRYALPNKVFDYIQAEIPVLVSDLPEMQRVVTEYDIGLVLMERNATLLASVLEKMVFDVALRNKWKRNLQIAANELCWENEEKKLIPVYREFLK